MLFNLQVVKYWAEKGDSGFIVYKFRLKRLDGQPPLTTNQVYDQKNLQIPIARLIKQVVFEKKEKSNSIL